MTGAVVCAALCLTFHGCFVKGGWLSRCVPSVDGSVSERSVYVVPS